MYDYKLLLYALIKFVLLHFCVFFVGSVSFTIYRLPFCLLFCLYFLKFTASKYSFGIFKLFMQIRKKKK